MKDLLYTKEIVLDNTENILSQIEKMKEGNTLSYNIGNGKLMVSSVQQLRLFLVLLQYISRKLFINLSEGKMAENPETAILVDISCNNVKKGFESFI